MPNVLKRELTFSIKKLEYLKTLQELESDDQILYFLNISVIEAKGLKDKSKNIS